MACGKRRENTHKEHTNFLEQELLEFHEVSSLLVPQVIHIYFYFFICCFCIFSLRGVQFGCNNTILGYYCSFLCKEIELNTTLVSDFMIATNLKSN